MSAGRQKWALKTACTQFDTAQPEADRAQRDGGVGLSRDILRDRIVVDPPQGHA